MRLIHRRQDSEESSHTFGKAGAPTHYLTYNAPAPGIITPPLTSMRAGTSFEEDGRSTSLSYFSISDSDDPAVRMSLGAQSQYGHSSLASPSLGSLPSTRSPRVQSQIQTSPRFIPQSPVSPVSLPARRVPTPPAVTLPYVCAFRMSTNGSMILAPPDTSTDLSPLYRVEVFSNVFLPTSFITKVYRGSTVYLGQFE